MRRMSNTKPPPGTAQMIIQLAALLVAAGLLLAETTEAAAAGDPLSPVQAIRFKMPKWVVAGADKLRLVCDYDLLGQTMHALKLFKDNKEFYRYTPDHRKLAFPVPGVNVDLERSNGHEVWLRRPDRRSAGEFRCEVSVEETFRSMSMARSLEVRSSPPPPPPQQPPGAPIDSGAAPPRQQSVAGSGSWNLLKSPGSRQAGAEQQAASASASSGAGSFSSSQVNPLTAAVSLVVTAFLLLHHLQVRL